MQAPKKRWTENLKMTVAQNNKALCERHVLSSMNYLKDPDKKERKAKQECKCCYYIYRGRCGGSAITTVECGRCDDIMTFGNTCVDVLCKKCGIETNCCIHCGGKID